MARNTNGKGFSLKDHLFNKRSVMYLGDALAHAYSEFNKVQFVTQVMQELPKLELKERIVYMAEILETQLPTDFKKAAKIIVSALPESLDPTKTDDDFGTFIFAPLGEYVVRNGLTKEYLATSLMTLKEITQRFSMEDAIRYFINEFPEETLREMGKWVNDPHYHVRRLVSEGTRPLLPWSGRICLSQKDTLPFLSALHTDTTRYVTRSVANHMNDISKTEPDLVVATLMQWAKAGVQDDFEMDWITRHSLRTLLKQGHTGALELLGYKSNPKITISNSTIYRTKIKIGETLDISFNITARRNEKLMIDYVIDFVKANGKTKPKVFKLKKVVLKKEETIAVAKKHRFLANATTFKLYPGTHTLTLQINGQKSNVQKFTVIEQ